MKSRTHTHTGHCQLCDRSQAINVKTGMIAKHGYSVDWSQFVGVCPGSDHLPYEKSADLIGPEADVQERIVSERLKPRLAEVKSFAKTKPLFGAATCTMSHPQDHRFGARLSSERTGFFSEEAGTYSDGTPRTIVVFTPETPFSMGHKDVIAPTTLRSDAARGECGLTGYHVSASAFASEWRDRTCGTIVREIQNRTTYVAFLRKRLAAWKLAELTPVVVKVEAKVGTVFTYNGKQYAINGTAAAGRGWNRAAEWTCTLVGLGGTTGHRFAKSHVTKLLNPPAPKGAK